jgi:hypothetical protein
MLKETKPIPKMAKKVTLSVPEVAEITTVYRLIKDINNPLPASRVRGHLRIRSKDLTKYLDDNKINPLE